VNYKSFWERALFSHSECMFDAYTEDDKVFHNVSIHDLRINLKNSPSNGKAIVKARFLCRTCKSTTCNRDKKHNHWATYR